MVNLIEYGDISLILKSSSILISYKNVFYIGKQTGLCFTACCRGFSLKGYTYLWDEVYHKLCIPFNCLEKYLYYPVSTSV